MRIYLLEYFFLSKENLPSGVGFSLYDNCHLTWLCLISFFIVIISIRYKTMTKEKKDITRKILGVLTLLTEVYYQSVLLITGQYNINYLPLHLCSVGIFLCYYDAFFPKDIIREFLYCMCMPGAFMALLFPNWTVCPLMNFNHINSFIVHGLIVCYPVMLMWSKEFTPNYKRLPMCGAILLTLVIPIYFFNKIFDTNFLFVNTPSEGSPLIVLENWLGNPGYIFGMLMMIFLFWSMLYTPVLIKNIQLKRNGLLET